jgi:hypothetical protein
MRHEIWKKDDFFEVAGQRIDMDPANVTLPDESPLVWQFNQERPPEGRVTDIRLEDGVILGEVTLFDTVQAKHVEDFLEEGLCRLGGYYTDVVKNEDGTQVLNAHLKGVSIVLTVNMPGATTKEKQ